MDLGVFSLLSLEKYCLRSPPPPPSPPIDRQQSNLLARPVRHRMQIPSLSLPIPLLLEPISRSPKPLCRFETRCQSAGTPPRRSSVRRPAAAGSPKQKSFVGLLKGRENRGGRAFLMLLFGGVSEVHRDRRKESRTWKNFRTSNFVNKSDIPMKL